MPGAGKPKESSALAIGMGTKVFIEDKKGKGKMVIEYYTLDDLDRILGILRKWRVILF